MYTNHVSESAACSCSNAFPFPDTPSESALERRAGTRVVQPPTERQRTGAWGPRACATPPSMKYTVPEAKCALAKVIKELAAKQDELNALAAQSDTTEADERAQA